MLLVRFFVWSEVTQLEKVVFENFLSSVIWGAIDKFIYWVDIRLMCEFVLASVYSVCRLPVAVSCSEDARGDIKRVIVTVTSASPG